MNSAAVGNRSSTGNPMAGATSTASPYFATLRGAHWSGPGLYPCEHEPQVHAKFTSFLAVGDVVAGIRVRLQSPPSGSPYQHGRSTPVGPWVSLVRPCHAAFPRSDASSAVAMRVRRRRATPDGDGAPRASAQFAKLFGYLASPAIVARRMPLGEA